MRYNFAFIILGLLWILTSQAKAGTRLISTLTYHHGTVGTTAADAITPSSVPKELRGWMLCHDAGSASTYLSMSEGADPDTDGIRLGPGQCFECLDCGPGSLSRANVKGSAASTGYSVIQLR